MRAEHRAHRRSSGRVEGSAVAGVWQGREGSEGMGGLGRRAVARKEALKTVSQLVLREKQRELPNNDGLWSSKPCCSADMKSIAPLAQAGSRTTITVGCAEEIALPPSASIKYLRAEVSHSRCLDLSPSRPQIRCVMPLPARILIYCPRGAARSSLSSATSFLW